MEKPAALTLDKFRLVKNEIDERNASVFVAAKRRFYRSYGMLRSLLNTKYVPRKLYLNLGRTFRATEFGWRSNPANRATSVFSDLGYHALDLAIWLNGSPVSWRASDCAREDMGTASLMRACIDVSAVNWPCSVELCADRIATSPFEQIVAVCKQTTFVCTPHTLHQLDCGTTLGASQTFRTGDEVDRMLQHFGDQNMTTTLENLGCYAEHQSQVAIAEAFRPDTEDAVLPFREVPSRLATNLRPKLGGAE